MERAGGWALRRAERVVYRVGGLPVALGALLAMSSDEPAAVLRAAYAAYFWNPGDLSELAELMIAGLIWPAGPDRRSRLVRVEERRAGPRALREIPRPAARGAIPRLFHGRGPSALVLHLRAARWPL
jgi:hypothetical protein